MEERVGWGIVGTGSRAREAMIPALLASPSSKVVGVCGREEDKTREDLRDFPELEVVHSFDDLVAMPEVDVIYIATPHFLHVPQAVQAIEAKKHVFMESPMALSVDGAHKLVEKSRTTGVKFGVAFHFRFHPALAALKRKIDDGSAGDILHINFSLSEPVERFSPWWTDSFRAGPAALLRVGVHALDLGVWLKGAPVAEVMAMGREDGDNQLTTVVNCMLRFADGSLGTIMSATCLKEPNHHAVMEGIEGRLDIRGDFSGNAPITITEYVGGEETTTEFEPEDPMGRMIDAFAEAVKTGGEFHPGGSDGKRAVECTCALIESIKSRRMVKVGEVNRQN